MKKYLIILFFIVLVVPSVTFAYWWNPFSWFNGWSFNKKENIKQVETETEKNNELQKQSNDLKNQQPSLNNDVNLPTKNPEVYKLKTPTQLNKEDNVNFLATSIYNGNIELTNMQINILAQISEDLDKNTIKISSLINVFKTNMATDESSREFYSLIIENYNKHLDNLISVKGKIDNYIIALKNYITELQKANIDSQNTFLSIKEIKIIKTTQDEQISQIEINKKTLLDLYYKYRDAFISDRDVVTEALDEMIYNTQSAINKLEEQKNNIPVYTPVIISTPKITTCNVNSLDNYFGSNSTVTCTSY